VIYNMDETFIQLYDNTKKHVVGLVGSANAYTPASEDRTHITVIESVSTKGEAHTPTVIFPGKLHSEAMHRGWPAGTVIGVSPNGWTSDAHFEQWMQKFIADTAEERAKGVILLILDGHSSHRYFEALMLAKGHNIEILCLPAHLTHVAQPLDRLLFGTTKTVYRDSVRVALKEGKVPIEHPARVRTDWHQPIQARNAAHLGRPEG